MGDTVGIIGGGQLGRMLAMAAARLGLKTIILDPQENAPAFQCAYDWIVAPFDDTKALTRLAELSDVITYEFENVSVETIMGFENSVPCHPNTNALSTSQDRLIEKRFFQDLGIETAPFHEVNNAEDLAHAMALTGGAGILKTRRFGYDGKGQVRLSCSEDERIVDAHKLVADSPCILEGLIAFEREISIIAARSTDGTVFCYDIAENVHRDGILFSSTVPANASDRIQDNAAEVAVKVLEALNYVGVIGIEFFVLGDGTLIANEFAPRVHNSGHWTEAACTISQFEQHIRAVSGLLLGNPVRHSNCMMQNLIGDEIEQTAEILNRDNTLLHLYGKSETRKGRKMGHFTTISSKS
ncbi:MAG: 5-(carboxyamino)imidazole ribonucleotide synthase [Rhizobiaceae bacterium]